MADKKAQFRRIIAARIARGDHYMTQEKFKAQMDFYKSVKSQDGEVETHQTHNLANAGSTPAPATNKE